MTNPSRTLPLSLFASRGAAEEATGGDRPRRPGPVFIQDAVTPWRGETLLLALWRADEARRNPEND
ncbi:MAG: hypothetical protein EP307_13475 [Rhodobacteraceae bacterium]|nr:MAG: hypothetical protein EP307_13475 [Paracoccaceae bacterium]